MHLTGWHAAARYPLRMHRHHATRAALAVVVLVLTACGQEPTPSASASTSASDAASPSAEESVHPLAGAWENVTDQAIGETADWSNKVELADINGDGAVDLLFANGGDYEFAGAPVASRAYTNNCDGTFTDATDAVFGRLTALTRVIKAADLNADGHLDLLMGTTFQTQTHLLLGEGDGTFSIVTDSHLPDVELSVGDLEVGDVDADGDLDVVLAHWGDGNPFDVQGRTQLWLNDGSAHFTDVTAERMPETLVGFSWELELLDVDNDWDLDVAVSCKVCPGSYLFENDGSGAFTDVTDGRMPAYTNNYEFTPVDLDGDGYLDLITINDGTDAGQGLPEHVFRNDGSGSAPGHLGEGDRQAAARHDAASRSSASRPSHVRQAGDLARDRDRQGGSRSSRPGTHGRGTSPQPRRVPQRGPRPPVPRRRCDVSAPG